MTSFLPISGSPISAQLGSRNAVLQPTLSVSATFSAPTILAGALLTEPTLSVTTTLAKPLVSGGTSATEPSFQVTAAFTSPLIAGGGSVVEPTLNVSGVINTPLVVGGSSVAEDPLNVIADFPSTTVVGGAQVLQPLLAVKANLPTPTVATSARVDQSTIDVTVSFTPQTVLIVFPVKAEPFRTYLVEFDHHDGNGVQTTRLTSGYGYRSAPSDTPALAAYEPRLSDAGSFQITAFEPGRTVGRASINLGEISAVNADGRFDDIITDAFDGRDVRIIQMPNERDALSQGTRLATLTMAQAEVSTQSLTLRLRDRLNLLDTDIQDNTYAGSTTSGTAGGAEGDSNLEDQIKPLVFGRALNVSPPPADRFNLIYQVSDSDVHDITAVYDKAIELLDPGTNQTSLNNLENATVQPARFHTAHSIGILKLGAIADGQVTADVVEGTTTSDRTAAQVAKRILLDQTDLTTSDIDDTTFSDLDAKNSAEVGVFIGNQRRAIDVVSDVLSSVGAFLTAKRDGKFAVYRLELPGASETPVQTYDENLIFEREDLERLPTGDEGRGIPTWKVTLKYKRNWTVQESDSLAGRAQACLGEDRKQFLRNQFQEVVRKDNTVKNKHKKPAELTFETLLVNRSAATAEAQRRLNIYSQLRERYQFRVKANFFDGVELNDTVKLQFPRFGLDSGKLFKVIGYSYDFEQDVVDVDVWGGV